MGFFKLGNSSLDILHWTFFFLRASVSPWFKEMKHIFMNGSG